MIDEECQQVRLRLFAEKTLVENLMATLNYACFR